MLLLVVAFNFYGYRLVISFIQQSNQAQVEARIDEREYDEAELISIKTTLNLPYYNSSPDFERTYGSININGIDYEYVKRRVYQDTVELLCLPNHDKTKLNAVSGQMAKGVADGASTPLKKATSFKISLPDFFQQISEASGRPCVFLSKSYNKVSKIFVTSEYARRQDRPPQSNA